MPNQMRLLAVLVVEARRVDPGRTVLVPLLLVAAGIGVMLQPWWLKVGLDGVTGGSRETALWAVLGFTVTLTAYLIFAALGTRTSRRLMENLALSTSARIAEMVAAMPTLRLLDAPAEFSRLAVLRERRQDFGGLINGTVNLAGLLARIAAAFVLLIIVHPALVVLVPATFAVALYGFRAQERLATVEAGESWRWTVLGELESLALSPSTAKEVKAWAAEPLLSDRHRRLGAEPTAVRAARWRAARAQATGGVALGVVFGAGVSLVATPGAAAASAGDLLLVALLITRLNETAIQMIPYGTWMAQSLVLPAQLSWLRAQHEAERPRLNEEIRPGAGPIQIDHVTFSYPESIRPALRDVTLELPRDSVVALVGANGAGKTTLVKLLVGLYGPDAGQIRCGEGLLRPANFPSWRQNLSGAFQDALRPQVTLIEAVAIGDLPRIADADAVRSALDRADADRLLASLPGGLDTRLGTTYGGVDLSGGQWQIVALARALMRPEPVLLVLDEPTAPLDAEAEERHYQRIVDTARTEKANGGITLIVTHRMAVAAAADMVVMLEDGCVCEVGTHSELLAAGGSYARFYSLQAAGHADEDAT